MIESVAIAFVLAFLFRTFEAEAFVIPTGSMAPTLMGRHKDVICPKCRYPYQVSASEEVMPDGTLKNNNYKVESGTCPMCRYTQTLDNDTSYNGDRILVSKLAYEIGEPQRWDMIVFKYPGDPPTVPPEERTDSRINFIKRLVGLPGDTVRIEHGDVWIKSAKDRKKLGKDAPFVIARKPPRKLLAMLQPVFDNDYMPAIAKDGWPARWFSGAEDAAGDWHSDDLASFAIDGSAKTEKWLRYHHLRADRMAVAPSRGRDAAKSQVAVDHRFYGLRHGQDAGPGAFRVRSKPQRSRHRHALGRRSRRPVRGENGGAQRHARPGVVQGRPAIPMPLRSIDRPGDPFDQRHGRLAPHGVNQCARQRRAHDPLRQLR